MERTEVLDMMGELKLYGMKAAYDETLATALRATDFTPSGERKQPRSRPSSGRRPHRRRGWAMSALAPEAMATRRRRERPSTSQLAPANARPRSQRQKPRCATRPADRNARRSSDFRRSRLIGKRRSAARNRRCRGARSRRSHPADDRSLRRGGWSIRRRPRSQVVDRVA